jgi:hypothetical protein
MTIVERLTHRAGCLDAELYQDLIEDLCEAADTIEALLEALEDVHARGATDGAGGVAIRMSLDRYAQLHTAIAKARGQS